MVRRNVTDDRIDNLEREMQELRLQGEAHMEEMRIRGEAHMEEMRKLLMHRTRRRRGRSRPGDDSEGEIERGQATKGKETNLTLKEEPPDDGSKVKISTNSVAAPEQVPHHRPTTTATTPKPPELPDGSTRVGAVATREEEKEQERDACHPDQRCRPKLQDNSLGWGKLNSTPWVKKGSTRKKKKGWNRLACFIRRLPPLKPPLHSVWVACEKRRVANVRFACEKRQKIRVQCRGKEEEIRLETKAHSQKLGRRYSKAHIIVRVPKRTTLLLLKRLITFNKLQRKANKCHCNNFKMFGYLSSQQWDPGG